MPAPVFYFPGYTPGQTVFTLGEDSSRHIVQVLRMAPGEEIALTDGRGHMLRARITDNHKKHCGAELTGKEEIAAPVPEITLAVSLVKNTSRFEWLLEKATETGVSAIVPLLCTRTEKEKFRADRLQGICVSAMLQSRQAWLPGLSEPVSFHSYVEGIRGEGHYFIAHCEPGEKKELKDLVTDRVKRRVILVGPEGDFTPDEIRLALEKGFTPVSLGNTRLRTETAGLVAAVLLGHI